MFLNRYMSTSALHASTPCFELSGYEVTLTLVNCWLIWFSYNHITICQSATKEENHKEIKLAKTHTQVARMATYSFSDYLTVSLKQIPLTPRL